MELCTALSERDQKLPGCGQREKVYRTTRKALRLYQVLKDQDDGGVAAVSEERKGNFSRKT